MDMDMDMGPVGLGILLANQDTELTVGMFLANQDTELKQIHSGRKAASRNSWGG